jgi:hypothetical protein
MRFSGLRRLWLVMATLSLLATPAFAAGALSFVCEGDQVARTECCCPGGHPGGTAAAEGATVSAACCCRVLRVEAGDAPAVAAPRLAAQVETQVSLAPASPLTIDAPAPRADAWRTNRLAQPPPRSVPILLAKQSLLV